MPEIVTPSNIREMLAASRFSRFHFIIIALCLLCTIGEGYNLFLYGSILPLLCKEWSLTSLQAGIIGSYGLIGMMFGSTIFGYLADKIGKKKVILICVFLYSSFTAACGLAPGPTSFSWFRFIAGLGLGGVLPNVVALITDYSPIALRNRTVAIVLCGIQIGGILGPVVSISTIQGFGWHAALWVGGLPLILIPLLSKLIPESLDYLVSKGETEKIKRILNKVNPNLDPVKFELEKTTNNKTITYRNLFDENNAGNTVMFCIAFFMTLLVIYGLGVWLPDFMMRAGYNLSISLRFPILLNVGGIVGTFIFAVIADRWNARKLLILIYLVGSASLALFGFKHHVLLLYTLVFIAGACVHGAQNIANGFIAQCYPSLIRSTGLGLCNGVGRLGAIIASTFWGILLQYDLSLNVIFYVFATPFLVAAWSFLRVRKTKISNGDIKIAD